MDGRSRCRAALRPGEACRRCVTKEFWRASSNDGERPPWCFPRILGKDPFGDVSPRRSFPKRDGKTGGISRLLWCYAPIGNPTPWPCVRVPACGRLRGYRGGERVGHGSNSRARGMAGMHRLLALRLVFTQWPTHTPWQRCSEVHGASPRSPRSLIARINTALASEALDHFGAIGSEFSLLIQLSRPSTISGIPRRNKTSLVGSSEALAGLPGFRLTITHI